MSVTDLNRVKYSGLDFDTHFDDLRARLQIKFAQDFNDFALSSLGIMLIDLVSYGLDALSFYLDRRATDIYLETARTRKAVARLTRQLGYKMRAAIASSVDLNVAVLNPQVFSIPVPKGFQFQGPNDVVFEAAQEVTFPPGSGSGDVKIVPCYEGQTFVETFVSDGSANQVFELRRVPVGSFVVSGTVLVKVNGADFSESEFITFDETDQFEVGYNDDPPTIRFGDGVAGNIPTAGATIQVTYVASRGRTGQVTKGTIEDVVTPLVVNFTTIRLSVANPKGSVGGDDPETIDHAKKFAGRVFKARQVAVTRSDYEALAGSFADPLFGRVAVAQALSSRSAASDLELQNLLRTITEAVSIPKPVVDAQVAAANDALDIVDAQLVTISADLTSLGTLSNDVITEADNSITSARATKNKAAEIGADAQDIQGLVIDGKGAVDAITTAGSSQLTTADKDNLKSFLDRINAQATIIFSASGTIDTSSAAEIASMGVVKDKANQIGTSVSEPDSQLLAIDTARAVIVTQVGVITPTATGIRSNLLVISTTLQDETSVVSEATASIDAHVDSILAADCKANLVTVPILARDAAGFYAAPSSSLIQALQAFLDARKEVTQTVVVTSGANFLVGAVLTVRIGIRLGVSSQIAKTAVETAVDGVLRDRAFGASLYISELMAAVSAVDGVAFSNVVINGHLAPDGVTVLTSNLDDSGNLIVPISEVVSKGDVVVNTPEVVSAGM
jgi:hypothetical protein